MGLTGLTQIAVPGPPVQPHSQVLNGVKTGRICLVIPPSIFLMDERVFMTLGILKIAAVLEHQEFTVDVLDLSGFSNFEEVVVDYIRLHPDTLYFGLTATTPQMPAVTKVVHVIRQERSSARVILGGPHITLINAAYKNEVKKGGVGRAHAAMHQIQPMFDCLVAGDGEEAIFAAIKESAPKLVDADDIKSSLFLTNAKLGELPFPARHLVDANSYRYSIDGVRAHSLIAQLGCPFECGFCGGRSSPMLRKIRTRSSENIVAEMVHIYETYGVRGFMLYDDELNVNKKMIELMDLIADAQAKLGVEWRLRGFIKAELFTKEQAEAMYRAGFRWILTGFESGSPKILTNINKKATREENTRCVQIAKAASLKVKALMSVGHAGESRQTVEETRQWLLETQPDDFDLTIITCYPGTPYYDEAVRLSDKEGVWVYTYKTGDRLYQLEVDYTTTADYYKGNIDGGYKAYVYTDDLSSEELVSLRDDVERDVRAKLGIPFNHGVVAQNYEHSMGQSGPLPPNILRTSVPTTPTTK
jgi:anaerobic magnesium-protoporphyrin IX monomethyl ester cyclase